MKRIALIAVFIAAVPGVWAFAQNAAQQPPANSGSIADYARKQQQQKANQASTKPAKVYTNDNVEPLHGAGGVTVAAKPLAPASPAAEGGAHDQRYYQKQYARLLGQKQLHERQVEVLRAKLAQGNIQYYSDPNKQLIQESTPRARSDINQLQAEVDAKKLEIQADDDAISKLQDQLRADGGDAGWLRGVSPSVEGGPPEVVPPSEEGKDSKDKKQTKEYWQSRFGPARANLKKAKEVQGLLQDEIDLLQKRKLTELSSDAQAEISQKLEEKQAQMATVQANLDKAQKELDDLQKEFDASGAPAEWSATD